MQYTKWFYVLLAERVPEVDWDTAILQHVQLGLGPSYKNKKTMASSYQQFCSQYRLVPFPEDIWQLRRYAEYLSMRVKTYETVHAYVSGVCQLHELLHIPAPKIDDYFTVLQLRALNVL